MIFKKLKNTVYFILLVCISCTAQENKKITTETIQVAANRTEAYLPLLQGKNVGVVGNQTSVIFKSEKDYTHLVDSLLSRSVSIKRVFAPEHGFRGTADAGERIEDGIDSKTGLPIISLYGDQKNQIHNISEIWKLSSSIFKMLVLDFIPTSQLCII